MDDKHLAISYSCLSSIGNSFYIESMMAEVVLAFYQATKAIFVGFFEDIDNEIPMIFAGKDLDLKIDLSQKECSEVDAENHTIIILPLKIGYMKIIYNKSDETKSISKMICNFQRKINFALSACEGVKKLEELNDKLEGRVQNSVKEIRNNEKLLLVQSKNAVMGGMLEMIAHQWRQPITTIGMISNNILFNIVVSEGDELDINILTNDLEDINRQIRYLSDTIDDFRGFFKDSKSKEKISIGIVIDASVSLVQKQFEQSSITINLINKCYETLVFIYKNELIQVLLNILNNSKDAFESQATQTKIITIECTRDSENILITLKDNAGGIKSDILLSVFEPYFSTKKEKNGTGLGLYMSKIIVNKHLSGDIFAQNIDDGAEFIIKIPLNEDMVEV